MPALSEYSNVHNTVFNILICKGYRLWHEKNKKDIMPKKMVGIL